METTPEDNILVEQESSSKPSPATSLSEQLNGYFPTSQDAASPSHPPQKLTDNQILEISHILKEQSSPWADTPRLYAILRLIDKLEEIEAFTAQGINDLWLPLTKRTFPRGLSAATRPLFLSTQAFVLSGSLDLEKGERGLHRHYAANEDVPLSSEGLLGKGSYGEVDRVQSTLTGSVYARKRIPRYNYGPGQRSDSRNRQIMADFEREIKAFKRLNHQHIVKLVGSYTDPSSIALIISPVADADLRSFLEAFNHTQPSKDLLCNFFGCLAAGLEYMHRSNVRHKDIKPANILVKGDRVLYADLGLAFCWDSFGQSTTEDSFPIATRKYSPPEALDGGKRNTAADVWSLGCVYLEMISLLHNSTLPKLQQHLESYGTQNSIYGRNHDGAITWLDQLKGMPALENARLLLEIVKEMMSKSQLRRPTAQTIFERICSMDEAGPLIGSCCKPPLILKPNRSFPIPITIPSIQISMPALQDGSSLSVNSHQTEHQALPHPPESPAISSDSSQYDGSSTPPPVSPTTPDSMSTHQDPVPCSPSISATKQNRSDRASLVRNTSLITAILHNDVAKARALIDEGADVNYQYFEGTTALNRAVTTSNTEMVSLFLEKGADIHLPNKEGETCFHYATHKANFEIINMLIDKGANVKQRGFRGRTPLSYAVTNTNCDRRQLIEFLISKGADPLANTDTGGTLLHRAAYYGSDNVIELLLSFGININGIDKCSTAPLHLAAENGHSSFVATLLFLGARTDIRGPNGNTPLMRAAMCGHVEVAQKLLESGANISAKNNFGFSPLLMAAEYGRLPVVEMLLGSRKIDLSQTLDKHGCSALHCAAYGGKISTVRALIEHGAEVDAREGAGLTPLHKAVLRKMQGTVKVLLEFGADPLAVTKRGASAIDLAMKDGLVDILHLLEDAIGEE